jgi:hypothetical protein
MKNKKSLAKTTAINKNKQPNLKKSVPRKKNVAQSLSYAIRDSVNLDQVILDLAAGPYNQILKQIEKSKKKLDQESRVALLLGSRILEKARDVRDQLVQQAQKVPGVAYVAKKTAAKNSKKNKVKPKNNANKTQVKKNLTQKKNVLKKSKRS